MPERTEHESIGARVRRLRLERGLSQRDLSEPGVSYAYVSRIEAGARQPSLKAVRLLATKLGVSAEYLETGAETPKAYDRELRLADAELALRVGNDAEQAEKAFRMLSTEARESADGVAETRARLGVGLALAHGGRYAEAIPQLERAAEASAVTPVSRPDAYAALGRCYAAVGEVRRAVSLFERCVAELEELAPADRAVELRFRSLLSRALTDAGDLDRSRSVLLEAAADTESRLDARGRAALYWSLARAASSEGEAGAAMAYARRAIGSLESSDDTLELARAHLHCADILLLEDRPEEAGPHLARADRLLDLGADPQDVAALRTQQAHHAVRLGQADEAIEHATAALGALPDEGSEQGSALHALGAAHAVKGDVEAAADSLRRAVDLLREAGEWREAMTAYRVWARVLREAGRNQEAFEVIEQATLLTLRNSSPSKRRPQARR